MGQQKVKRRLADTGYLAFQLHVSLQDPHWLAPGTDPMKHMEQFMHFKIENPLSLSKEGSFKPFLPEPFDKSLSPKLSVRSHGSLSMSRSTRDSVQGASIQEEPPMIELTERKDSTS